MNLKMEAHDGHRLSIWPRDNRPNPVYCHTCDLFLDWSWQGDLKVGDISFYIHVEAVRVFREGEGPAWTGSTRQSA